MLQTNGKMEKPLHRLLVLAAMTTNLPERLKTVQQNSANLRILRHSSVGAWDAGPGQQHSRSGELNTCVKPMNTLQHPAKPCDPFSGVKIAAAGDS